MSAKFRNRFRSLFVEVVALIILVPLSIFLFIKISNHQQKEQPVSSQSPVAITESVQTSKPSVSPSIPLSQQPTSSASVTLEIFSPNKSSSYKIPTNKSLLVVDVMKIAESQGMTMKTKDYGAPLGLLIESINNIQNDPKNQKYWTLYINDKMSVTGASSTTVSPQDTVTWKFETTTL
jgi:hypothetical protein